MSSFLRYLRSWVNHISHGVLKYAPLFLILYFAAAFLLKLFNNRRIVDFERLHKHGQHLKVDHAFCSVLVGVYRRVRGLACARGEKIIARLGIKAVKPALCEGIGESEKLADVSYVKLADGFSGASAVDL